MSTQVDTVVRARIDSETKRQAAEALESMGLSISDYIRMALVRVAKEKAVPFAVHVPNEQTAKVLSMADRGDDVHNAKDKDDLFAKLGI